MTSFAALSERPISSLSSSQSFAANVASIYLSTDGFISDAWAAVANTNFLPRVSEALDLTRSMVNSSRIGGPVSSAGEIIIHNTDGYFDNILTTYAIDGRRVVVRMGRPTFRYGEFVTIFDGTAREWIYDESSIRLPVRDNMDDLFRPIQGAVYTSVTTDGGPNLAGKPKPLLFGKAFNVAPPLIDTSGLVYQVNSDGSTTVSAVYDQGVSLVSVASSPAAGQYSVNASAGTFTLGGTPAGLVTCTARGVSAASTTAQIVQRIVENYASLDASDMDLASFTQAATDNSASVGIWIGTDVRTTLDVLDELMAGIGGWFGYDRDGRLQIGVIKAPAAPSIADFDQTDIIEIERIQLPTDISPPNWRRRVGYQKNCTIQSTDLAGSVTDARRQFLREQYRVAATTDVSVQTKHLLATDPSIIPALYINEADAKVEASRLLTLYKGDRALYRIIVKVHAFGLKMGQVVSATYPRWDLSGGKYFLIVGISERASKNEVELEIFG